jgi:hypothetical protein
VMPPKPVVLDEPPKYPYSDGGAAGAFGLPSLTSTGSSLAQTSTYTPAKNGTKTIMLSGAAPVVVPAVLGPINSSPPREPSFTASPDDSARFTNPPARTWPLPPGFNAPRDREADAMAEIARLLKPLNQAARGRVLDWAVGRFHPIAKETP